MEDNQSVIEQILRTRGLVSATDLALMANTSQPTVSRAIARLGTNVRRIGRGRTSLYVHIRNIGTAGHEWPLYRITNSGTVEYIGRLTSLVDGWLYVPQGDPGTFLEGSEPETWFPRLPWFLQEARPQGFLGKHAARSTGPLLGTSTDPQLWSDDDVLTYLLHCGHDHLGNLVLGEEMLKAYLFDNLRVHPKPPLVRFQSYDTLAEHAAGTCQGCLLAPGDHPKFLVEYENTDGTRGNALVKYAENFAGVVEERQTDLLTMEHMALYYLQAMGMEAVSSCIHTSDNYVFLEVQRSDRTPEGGRRGLLGLQALDDGCIGTGAQSTWPVHAQALHRRGWITRESAEAIQSAYWFGVLIGNNDMHRDNLSFLLDGPRPLALAPLYDMLPMQYSPTPGGVVPMDELHIEQPGAADRDVWLRMIPHAIRYWREVAGNERISDGMRSIARQNADHLVRLQQPYLDA